ncbi:MAG: patatin-like phospholipase family protein [Bacteroidota bacterium]
MMLNKRRLTLLFLFAFFWSMVSAQRVGLVLSGGGARGLAHIGVIKALEENNIPIDYITGTSAGAVVGCLYALGYSPREMDSIVRTGEFESWATGKLNRDNEYFFSKTDENASWIYLRFALASASGHSLPTNVVSSVPYDYALLRGTSAIIARAGYQFDSLFIPFRCVASDIEKKKTVVFRSGDLARAVRASSAYPFYFRPVNVDGKVLYDGGLYDNLPLDVMESEFHPDFTIGVNASGNDAPTDESDLVSLLQVMMTNPSTATIEPGKGLLIDLETNDLGLFDFSNVAEIVDRGYTAAKSVIDSLKRQITAHSDSLVLHRQRGMFRSEIPRIRIKLLETEGISEKQQEYVRRLVKPEPGLLSLEEIRNSYFRLVADNNIRSVDPKLILDPSDSTYMLLLKIRKERNLVTRFGGNISSRPISEAFAGITYHLWGKRAYSFIGNFYFGRLYTSGQTKIRMDAPSKRPFFLEADATLNQYDYFRSANAFFSEQRPAYIIRSDYYFGMNAGTPVGNQAVITGGAGYVRVSNNYFQTMSFTQSDTADKTVLGGFSGFAEVERNTLNKKQYANEGGLFRLRLRAIHVDEETRLGTTSTDRTIETDRLSWWQLKMHWESYLFSRRHLKLGFSVDGSMSNYPLMNNYSVTMANCPSYEPILEMHTLLLTEFRAPTYIGLGSRNVLAINSKFDLRVEGYVFQPYKELLRTQDNKTESGKAWDRRYYLASSGVVYHSPIGPLSLHVNYYRERKNPVSVLFTAGFLLFNPSALD